MILTWRVCLYQILKFSSSRQWFWCIKLLALPNFSNYSLTSLSLQLLWVRWHGSRAPQQVPVYTCGEDTTRITDWWMYYCRWGENSYLLKHRECACTAMYLKMLLWGFQLYSVSGCTVYIRFWLNNSGNPNQELHFWNAPFFWIQCRMLVESDAQDPLLLFVPPLFLHNFPPRPITFPCDITGLWL